jgi:peroxiredoxin Q/BCP
MVELRKRPARDPPAAREAKKASTPTTKSESKKPGPAKKIADAASKLKEKVTGTTAAEEEKAVETTETPAAKSPKVPAKPLVVGDTITIEGFGGEVVTHDGKTVTVKQLLEESKSGIGMLFL